jgi:Xaa-Pro aminopeptidase
MSQTPAPAHHQTWFDSGEFKTRHEAIYADIGGAVAVVQGAGPVFGFEVFRQTNEFFYLTGLDVPRAYLVLDGGSHRSTLLLPAADAKHAASEGAELSTADAELLRRLTGVDEVAPIEKLNAVVGHGRIVWTPLLPAEGNMACQDTLRHAGKLIAGDPWVDHRSREAFFAEMLKSIGATEICDLSPTLVRLRLHKSPAELAVLRRAGQLTALAVNEAMKATRPGVYEYQLGAIAEYVYRINGSRGAAYRPIIATGENIWFLHYYRNTSPLAAGEWVLMDVAPDVNNYTSDIGRFWPVDGKYTDRQRRLYGFMVAWHQTYLRHIAPGLTAAEIDARVVADMLPVVGRMKFDTAAEEKGVRAALARPTGLTHTVGMAVHDNGSYKDQPLKPGLVFALDPQMWIPKERTYVRVEDTVAVTADGVENLTPQCPLELDEVETMMQSGPGMLQVFPATTSLVR